MRSPTDTRERVMHAALETIQSEGYYRASSNAIARRADVSWGVIQHHFKTREALLLAVLENEFADVRRALELAEITGASGQDRLAAFADMFCTMYRRPDYLAVLEIVSNLSRDPDTRADTAAAIRGHVVAQNALVHALLAQVAPSLAESLTLRETLMTSLGGMAMAHNVTDLFHDWDPAQRRVHENEHRLLLVQALATLL